MLHGYTGKRRATPLRGLRQLADRYRVVSFDIFDTLVRRDAADPSAVFTMMERALREQDSDVTHFRERRLEAERLAREELTGNGRQGEVTLDDIYERLEGVRTEETRRKLPLMEMHWEETLAQPDPQMKKVWEYCLAQGKTVVLVSDMYLPRACVQRILGKCGYQIAEDRLFLSSEEQSTKRHGELYRKMCEALGVTPADVLHIGDHWISDGLNARMEGLRTFPVSRNVRRGEFFNDRDFASKEQQEDYRSLCAFTDNHTAGTPYFRRTGFSLLGPLLYGFSRWLEEKAAADGIRHLFFLSRDGALLERAFGRNGVCSCPHSYLYASRRALIVPTLRNCFSARDLSRRMFWPAYGTVGAFLRQIGLDPGEHEQTVRDCGFDPDEMVPLRRMTGDGSLDLLFSRIGSAMRENAEKEHLLLTEYLRQSGFSGKIGVVDIGWHGNMQRALQEASESAGIPAEIYGYYVGLNPDADSMGGGLKHAAGYLFSPGEREEAYARMQNFIPLFEFFFGAAHGTVERFERGADGRIVPCLAEREYAPDSEEAMAMLQLQDGAMACLDLLTKTPEFSLQWAPEIVFRNFELLGNAPDLEAVRRFGGFRISDSDSRTLAPTAASPLLHPRALVSVLRESGWRIGTLRGSFRSERLPGYELMSAARKAAEKRNKI